MAKRSKKYLGGYTEWPLFFKGFLVLGIVLIAAVFFFYTQTIISQIKENSRRVMNTYARLWQLAASAPTGGAEIDVIFEEIIQKSDFPIVVTDAEGELLAWRGVGVDWDDTTYMSREKLKKMAHKMDKHRKPIPIYFGTRQEIINYLHYGDPVLISQLRMMTLIELGLLSLFVLIAFITFRNIKMAEQRTIWVGMAKETAHQLGTPISSLLGWLELLKIKRGSQTQKKEGDSDLDFEINSDDRILVKSIYEYHLRHQVEVTGEVLYPGVYPIVEKETRLSEIIVQAGGFTKEAGLADAKIIRTAEEEVSDPEFERLKQIPVADMTEMEYEYFKTKSREKAYVVVDFESLFLRGDSTQDIYLRDEDKIYIPMKAKTVRVSGQVINPGLVNWEPNKNYLYYIEKCGGFAYNARKSKIRIIRAATGTWLKPRDNTIVNVGDTIFIPEVPEREYWEIFKDVLLVTSQMVTIIVLINTITK